MHLNREVLLHLAVLTAVIFGKEVTSLFLTFVIASLVSASYFGSLHFNPLFTRHSNSSFQIYDRYFHFSESTFKDVGK